MRGRTKLVSLVTMLAVLLTVSMVFASGLVDVSKISLFSEPPVELGNGTVVFVDPAQIVKDYVDDPGYQIGDTFVFHINITGVTDLFSYQVNVTWNTAMLNFTGIWAYEEFLARTGSPDGTSRIEDIYVASNETGYAAIAETILGDYAGITGSGRLVTIEFEIVGYGSTDMIVGTGGLLPTTLLDSTGTGMAFTTADGYFRNTLPGDIQGDAPGTLPDGDVDYYDFLRFAGSYLKTVSLP